MTERALPAGWAWTTLGDVAEYINGRGFKKSEWGLAGRPIIRIQNLTGSGSTFNYYSGEVLPKHVVKPNDLLVSWAATLSVHRWTEAREGALNQHIFKVTPSDAIDSRFLEHSLRFAINDMYLSAHGSGMVHVTRGKFESTEIPLPPLPEQHRIVEVLEDHLSRLDVADSTLKAQLIRSRRLLDRQLISTVHDAGGEEVRIADILLRKPANGRSVPTAEVGFPVLRLTSLRDGVIDLAERKIGEWSAADAGKFLVDQGDILLSRGNGSLRLVGRAGIVDANPDPVAYPDTMIRLSPDGSQVLPKYLVMLWNSRVVRSQIESAARTTAGIYKINQSIVSDIRIPLPSLERQQQVVNDTGEVADAVRRLAADVGSAVSRSAALRRALLRSAFNGELVDQDPGDAPADVALAKIRALPTKATRSRKQAVTAQ